MESLETAASTSEPKAVELPEASAGRDWGAIGTKVVFPLALAVSLSIWFLALRAPLWLDETLAYWQVNGGLGKLWSRSALMPSSIGYLFVLWLTKTVFGSREIVLKVPSLLALLAAVYFLYQAVRRLLDQETAFLACIFFALEGNVVFAATDARPYAFALLATNLAVFAFVRWMAEPTAQRAILFGAAAAGILYFHYLFASVLPVFAAYYLIARWHSIKEDAKQIAAVLASFALLTIPLAVRVASLYQSRDTHIVPEVPHPFLMALNTLAPKQLMIGFIAAAFLAALLRKLRLPDGASFPAVVFGPLLAFVPAAVLFALSAATPMHLILPRYLSVVAPGSALTWGILTRCIDSRLLRQIFCVGLVGVTAFEAYSSPYSGWHEVNFKHAHALVNANTAGEEGKVPVLECSAFIESNYEPLPTDRESENALNSQIYYYPVNEPVIMLPLFRNAETERIAADLVTEAAQKHQRFLLVAGLNSYQTIQWLARYSSPTFTARVIGDFRESVVVEFTPSSADQTPVPQF